MNHLKIFFCIVLINTLFFSCTEKAQESSEVLMQEQSHLGDIDFKVSGAAAAIPYFEKGLLLLHSFEYEDAREAFLEAQEVDSTFAMAYWGEAMTYNHALWQYQEKEAAIAALQKLAPEKEARAAMLQSDLEKDFFEGIEILFGEGTKYERDLAYKNYMETLTKKYPAHHEVAAFYAISLLGAARNGRDEILYDKSAKIAKGIISENPNHPGALHYLIHSYDDPEHANMAKNAADSYSKVAPDAAHALHMPSHIYVALGQWNEVVTSNIASWNASVKRMENKMLDGSARSYHALAWLHYGFLQRGEYEKASKLMEKMVEYVAEDDNKRARLYAISMKGRQLVETDTWEGTFADITVDVEDLNIVDRAGHSFIEGKKSYHQKDAEKMKTVIDEMMKDRQVANTIVGDSGFAMCSANSASTTSQLDVDMAHILELELRAYLADLKGDTKAANNYFEEGIAIEERLDYSFGPPLVYKPIHEAYGEYLLAQDEAEKALMVFEKSLEVNPRRLFSLKGKQAAAKKIGSTELLEAAEQELALSLAEEERKEIL